MTNILKKSLVFGATGQDGYFMTKYLLQQKKCVLAVCRASNLLLLSLKKKYKDKLKIICVKKLNNEIFDRVFLTNNISKIFFFIGYSKIPKTLREKNKCYEANYYIFKLLLNYLLKKKIFTKILYLSSGEIFGSNHKVKKNENSKINPTNYYAKTKVMSLKLSRLYNKKHNFFISNAICYNHDSFLSPSSHLIRKFINLYINAKHKIIIYNKNEFRNFSHVYDFLIPFDKILDLSAPTDMIFANNSNYRVYDILKIIQKKLNKNIKIEWKTNKNYKTSRMANNKKIVKELSYRPSFDLSKLIEQMIFYQKKNLYFKK